MLIQMNAVVFKYFLYIVAGKMHPKNFRFICKIVDILLNFPRFI